jgi:hypothetical protein
LHLGIEAAQQVAGTSSHEEVIQQWFLLMIGKPIIKFFKLLYRIAFSD